MSDRSRLFVQRAPHRLHARPRITTSTTSPRVRSLLARELGRQPGRGLHHEPDQRARPALQLHPHGRSATTFRAPGFDPTTLGFPSYMAAIRRICRCRSSPSAAIPVFSSSGCVDFGLRTAPVAVLPVVTEAGSGSWAAIRSSSAAMTANTASIRSPPGQSTGQFSFRQQLGESVQQRIVDRGHGPGSRLVHDGPAHHRQRLDL